MRGGEVGGCGWGGGWGGVIEKIRVDCIKKKSILVLKEDDIIIPTFSCKEIAGIVGLLIFSVNMNSTPKFIKNSITIYMQTCNQNTGLHINCSKRESVTKTKWIFLGNLT